MSCPSRDTIANRKSSVFDMLVIGSSASGRFLVYALEPIANVSNTELFRLAIVSLLRQLTIQSVGYMYVHIYDNPYYHGRNTHSNHNETQIPILLL